MSLVARGVTVMLADGGLSMTFGPLVWQLMIQVSYGSIGVPAG